MRKKFYSPTRGPLKGRRYKSQATYRTALKRSITKEERYNQLLQEGILQKGSPNKKSLKRFEELYRKAKATGWDPCPPANDVKDAEKSAPYAVLLDYIGVRPLDEFGWLCIGDTPENQKSK
jgi:hypothetical protein